MTDLSLTLSCGRPPIGPGLAATFAMDLEREVGAVRASPQAERGAKGAADVATIAVAILGTQAVAQLVGILKSYFERDRSLEVEVAGTDWKVRIKGADGRRMSAFDLEGLINRAIKGQQGERADASGDPGRI